MTMNTQRMLNGIPYVAAIGLLVAATLAHGVPALRHDWLWPVDRAAFVNSLANWTSGWDPSGLGRPAPHLTQYILAAPLLLIGFLFGSAAALAIYLSLIGFLIAHAARRIAARFGLSPIAALAIALLLTASPWTYNELVAGHLAMLLAYACTALLCTELLMDEPDVRLSTLCVFGIAFQPQFFLLIALLCIARFKAVAARAGLAYGAVAFLPYVVGVTSQFRWIEMTPFAMTWERMQSVPLAAGVVLRGYFTHYSAGFDGPLGTTGVLFFALMALAAPVVMRRRRVWILSAILILLLFGAAGTSGPLSAIFVAGFRRVPAFGLYRELYDLVGLVAVGYALSAGIVFSRFPVLRWPALISASLLLVVWLVSPPSQFWVSLLDLPPPPRVESGGRYALMPPHQPLSYDGRGSGMDPAFMYASLAATPLNTYALEFPESNALQEQWSAGRDRALARLGTTQIICRKGFRESNAAAVVLGDAIKAAGSQTCEQPRVLISDPAPIIALQGAPHICSLCSAVGDGNIFFGDVDGGVAEALHVPLQNGAYVSLAAPRGGADPATEWIDARLEFVSDPSLSQAFGGVFTTSSSWLSLQPARFVLVNVRGKLRARSGAIIAQDTAGYRWTPLPKNAVTARCVGRCTIALEGTPSTAPLDASPVRAQAVSWKALTPWLLLARVPAGRAQIIRYLESYDRWWVALYRGRTVFHVRLDASINGWTLPPRAQPETIVLLHESSLVQIFCELVGVAAFLHALLRRIKPTARSA